MPRKPFKTIDEQIEILASRGLSTDEGSASILLGENYYCVVNGYKSPFIDREATSKANHDVYADGTSLNDLYALFCFDRDLRNATFRRLLQAEARVRSVAAYTFCERFRDRDAYLKISSYTDAADYMPGPERYDADIARLISLLRRKAKTQEACKDFVAHYRARYDEVPLWVLAKDLTFGNVAYFYNLQKRGIQNAICKRIVELRGDPERAMLTPHEMRLALRTLVEFRNICAHDERLWCAKAGPVKDEDFPAMMGKLGLVLGAETVRAFRAELGDLVGSYAERSPHVGKILRDAGFGPMSLGNDGPTAN